MQIMQKTYLVISILVTSISQGYYTLHLILMSIITADFGAISIKYPKKGVRLVPPRERLKANKLIGSRRQFAYKVKQTCRNRLDFQWKELFCGEEENLEKTAFRLM